ncbi:MAG: WGR domain-containing protein [Cytophagia bacterium]|nr:WGR domain-containing protein [Cytophagia bacterium]
MMKHHLTYKDDKSDKFWQIETNGKSFTVTYGKTRTDGSSQTKTFDNDEKCLKEAEKLLNEKLKKGYKNTQISKGSKTKSQSSWDALVNSSDKKQALIEHFEYLTESPSYKKVLSEIASKATNIAIDQSRLIISFPKGKLIASSPDKSSAFKKWPRSFQRIVSQHSTLYYPKEGWALCLGDPGNFEDELIESVEEFEDKEIMCALGDFSDWWIFHPKQKNSNGEPKLCFVDHGEYGIENYTELTAGELFLHRMAELMEIDLKKIVSLQYRKTLVQNTANAKNNKWTDIYNKFSTDWKKYLSSREEITETKRHEKIGKLTSLSINDTCGLKTIDNLLLFPALEQLNLEITIKGEEEVIPKIKNLKSLSLYGNHEKLIQNLPLCSRLESLSLLNIDADKIDLNSLLAEIKYDKLKYLEIYDCQITSLPDSIVSMKNLEQLSLRNNKLSDLPEKLKNLSALKYLSLEENNLTEMPEVIQKLSKLESLDIYSNKISKLSSGILSLKNLESISLDSRLFEDFLKLCPKMKTLTSVTFVGGGLPKGAIKRLKAVNSDIDLNHEDNDDDDDE